MPLTLSKFATFNYSSDQEAIIKFGDDLVLGNFANSNPNSSTKLYDCYKNDKYPDTIDGYRKFTGSDNKKFLIDEW